MTHARVHARSDRLEGAEEVIPELRASLKGTQFTPENLSTMADRVGLTQVTPRSSRC